MKTLKQLIAICMMLFTLCNIYPLQVNATSVGGTVNEVTATGDSSGVSVSGTVDADVLAVVVQVYKGEELVAMETTGVTNNQTFNTRLSVNLSAGEYTIYVTNFAGGAWTTGTFTIAATTTPGTTTPGIPNYGGSGSSTSSSAVPTTPQDTIPTNTIINALNKVDDVSVTLTEPSTVPTTILSSIIGKDKNVTFEVVNENKEVAYSFTINGKDLESTTSFNMKISNTSENEIKVKELTNKKLEILEFAHSGNLPGKIQVKIKTSYTESDHISLYYFNETNNKLELVTDKVVIENGYAIFEINHCSTYVLVEDTLDLSDYTNDLLPVYENSRVTSIKSVNGKIEINGYAFTNGISFNKADSLWREVIFVNEEDTSKEKAYRMQVTSIYNTFLNANKSINPEGKLSYAYANYRVTIDPNAIKDYLTNTTYQKMASGSYRVYVRVSDGKNGKLFPLRDAVLSDGSTMESAGTLPSGFSVADQETRTLVYTVK